MGPHPTKDPQQHRAVDVTYVSDQAELISFKFHKLQTHLTVNSFIKS